MSNTAVAAFSVRYVVPAWAAAGNPVITVYNLNNGAMTALYPLWRSATGTYDLVLADKSTTVASWLGGATGKVWQWWCEPRGGGPSSTAVQLCRRAPPPLLVRASDARR